MTTYSYVIARFVPDMVKNEPINVGVLLQSDNKKIEGKFIENFRTLAMRYHDVNVKALQGIFDSFRGSHEVNNYDHLEKLSTDFQYQLLFTRPTAIVAGTPQQAMEKLYEKFISVEPKKRIKKSLTRIQLRSLVRTQIEEKKFERKWFIPKHIVKGPKDHFEFDFAFKNGKVSDLLHTISFEGNAKNALILAKALALTVEYVMRDNAELSCAALIHPPLDDEKERDFYEPAIGYLKDQQCAIKTEEEIPQYITQIRKKLVASSH